MTRRVLLRADAQRDLSAAASWYEEQPLSFPQVYGELRRALMRRFPFGVFFCPEPARLVVLAVLHASRDPGRWKRRRG